MHGGSRQGSRGNAHSGARSVGGRGAPGKTGASKAGRGRADRPGAGSTSGRRGEAGSPPGGMPDSARLIRLLEPVVHALGLDLESVRVSAAGRRRLLRVIVDAEGGVSLDTIALTSRELSARLDGSPEMGELPYTLEVSSPGVDRPLTEPRHWRRALGRIVVAPLTGQGSAQNGNEAVSVQGRIADSSATGVTLDCDGHLREYSYAELGPGRVQVEFGRLEPDEDEIDDEGLGEDQDEED
jgi:ribosome maturation factor RimP